LTEADRIRLSYEILNQIKIEDCVYTYSQCKSGCDEKNHEGLIDSL
jgi:hypothetical protein